MDAQMREMLLDAAPEDARQYAEAVLPHYLKRAFSGPHQVPDTEENRALFEPILKEVICKALEPLMGQPVGFYQIHGAILTAAGETARSFRPA